MDWTKQYKKAVTFSYDDGVLQDKRLVELFNQYGLKCTFNINTDLGNPQGSFLIKNKPIHRFSMEELSKLYQGHEVASHSLHHYDLTKKTKPEIIHEIKEDMDNITKMFRMRPVGFIYPYGVYNQDIKTIIKDLGIHYARTVVSTHSFDLQKDLLEYNPTCHHNDPKVFDLIHQFLSLNNDQPQLLYIWGHSYEFDVDDNWEIIEEICQLLSNHPDIFYGTNKEVFWL
jgi:peptidoglycan/xylan/chitin deacetylase (PgdA/CDA1 family)